MREGVTISPIEVFASSDKDRELDTSARSTITTSSVKLNWLSTLRGPMGSFKVISTSSLALTTSSRDTMLSEYDVSTSSLALTASPISTGESDGVIEISSVQDTVSPTLLLSATDIETSS